MCESRVHGNLNMAAAPRQAYFMGLEVVMGAKLQGLSLSDSELTATGFDIAHSVVAGP